MAKLAKQQPKQHLADPGPWRPSPWRAAPASWRTANDRWSSPRASRERSAAGAPGTACRRLGWKADQTLDRNRAGDRPLTTRPAGRRQRSRRAGRLALTRGTSTSTPMGLPTGSHATGPPRPSTPIWVDFIRPSRDCRWRQPTHAHLSCLK